MLFLNRMYLPLMPRFSLSPLVAISLFCVLLLGSLQAFDGPDAFTVNLPLAANAATPVWLGYPQVPATTFAALDLPIQPPDTESSLLVTVSFQEKPWRLASKLDRICFEKSSAKVESAS